MEKVFHQTKEQFSISTDNHPGLQGLRRFCLTTKDAQNLYSQFDFEVTKTPGYWMEIKDNDIYKRAAAAAESAQ